MAERRLSLQPEAVPVARRKGDVVADFVASCRKAGIRPGLFFSTSHNAYWQVWDHYVDEGKGKGTAKQAAFNKSARR